MSRPALLRRSNNELKQMSDLNNRFVNFIQLVKSETVRSEELQQSLADEKEKYFADFKLTNRNYMEKLNTVKKYLNELCMGVCEELVREKRNRTLADWYKKLAKFEESLTSCGSTNTAGSNISVVLNSSGYFETSSPCSNSYVNSTDFYPLFPSALSEVTLAGDPPAHPPASHNLINLSAISSSQSSLNSCSSSNLSISPSSSSSSSSSSAYTTETTRTSSHIYSSPDQFSLEVYLNTLTKTRAQLGEDFERKQAECVLLKQNIVALNSDLNGLNDNLDSVKIENVKLQDDIKNMRREIDLLRELYAEADSGRDRAACDDWMRSEIESARAEIALEYDEFTSQQLAEYEGELERELMLELDRLDDEYLTREETIDNESAEILDELIELNSQLIEDFNEFETLSRINSELNDRLIHLSSCLIEFNSMSKEKQERMMVNYSIVSLRKENETRRTHVKELKQELSIIKSQLIQNDAFDLILGENHCPEQQLSLETAIGNDSFSSTRLLDTSANRLILLQQQELLLKELDEIKCAFHIRPYCAQIEYTKSNLFAYFLIKFDIIYHNYATANGSPTQSPAATSPKVAVTGNNSANKNNCILNSLKIVYDSIDGHSILIENCHRILDIDLSEWTLRREIYQDAPPAAGRRSRPDFTVEYKFPKGFRLKRRKKINLIAAGKQLGASSLTSLTSSSQSRQHGTSKLSQKSASCNSLNGVESIARDPKSRKTTPIKPACSSLALNRPQEAKKAEKSAAKCSCCACKTMTTRKGDIEFFEIDEVGNWGSGILVLTKLINTKNVTKMVNYRYLKHIWVNNHEKKLQTLVDTDDS